MYLGEKEMLEFLSRRWESSAGNKEVQRFRGTERCRAIGTESYRGAEVEVQRGQDVQRYRMVQRVSKILRGTAQPGTGRCSWCVQYLVWEGWYR